MTTRERDKTPVDSQKLTKEASPEPRTLGSSGPARTISLERFQAVVLRLANQTFVRSYLWLNYPNDPQLLGIQFSPPFVVDFRLAKELIDPGFEHGDGELTKLLWTIERKDDAI